MKKCPNFTWSLWVKLPVDKRRWVFLVFHTGQLKTVFFVNLWFCTPFPPELHSPLQWIKTSLECSFLLQLFFTNFFKVMLNPKYIGNICTVHSTVTVILGETCQNFWSDSNFMIVLLSLATFLKFPQLRTVEGCVRTCKETDDCC